MYLQREVPPPFNIQFCLIHPHGLILRIFEMVLVKNDKLYIIYFKRDLVTGYAN